MIRYVVREQVPKDREPSNSMLENEQERTLAKLEEQFILRVSLNMIDYNH